MTALLPGFYRHRIFGSRAVRVDHVHGHLTGDPVLDVTWLARCPTGWRVEESDVWLVFATFALVFEPMDPPR